MRKKIIKGLILSILLFFMGGIIDINASNKKENVRIVTSGEGLSKTEATNSALRSAIEQVYGTFVSTNTVLLNDELEKDEIVTVSSGNINSYKYISEIEKGGKFNVTIEANVSVGKLIKYAQSKGAMADLAGEKFNQDLLTYEFYKQNEQKVINHLTKQIEILSSKLFYGYEIQIDNPKLSIGVQDGPIYCSATINYQSNFNLLAEHIWKTLASISMSEDEIKWCNNVNVDYDCFILTKPRKIKYKLEYKIGDIKSESVFFLRNKKIMNQISEALEKIDLSFNIKCKSNNGENILFSGMNFESPWQLENKRKNVLYAKRITVDEYILSREQESEKDSKYLPALLKLYKRTDQAIKLYKNSSGFFKIFCWRFRYPKSPINGNIYFDQSQIRKVSKIEIE